MKRIFTILLFSTVSASLGNAASKSGDILNSSVTLRNSDQYRKTEKLRDKLTKINEAAVFEKNESREAVVELGRKIQKDVKDLEVNQDFIKAARDKSLDWKTRYLLMERVGQGDKKNITKDEELTLFSDALLDGQEHNGIRKLAAELLMEPARAEMKARETLTNAAKDKNIPGEVLQSVMVSVGYSGIDDTDLLAELMSRKPKGANEMGINLNAVRALGGSRDPRAIGMLFNILDKSQPDSFYHYTALEQFSRLLEDPVNMKKIAPMLTPRLLKLLPNPKHPGVSRLEAAQILVKIKERKAIPPILTWLKPKNEGGGGDDPDVIWAAEILAEFKAKEAVPELENVLANFAKDPRWNWIPKENQDYSNGNKRFPEDTRDYKHLQECLKKLKGEKHGHLLLPRRP